MNDMIATAANEIANDSSIGLNQFWVYATTNDPEELPDEDDSDAAIDSAGEDPVKDATPDTEYSGNSQESMPDSVKENENRVEPTAGLIASLEFEHEAQANEFDFFHTSWLSNFGQSFEALHTHEIGANHSGDSEAKFKPPTSIGESGRFEELSDLLRTAARNVEEILRSINSREVGFARAADSSERDDAATHKIMTGILGK